MSYVKNISSTASEDRIEKLIEERLKPGADKKSVDQRIWDLFGEEWAIVFTDLSGFSRNVSEFGIIHFLQIIHEAKKLFIPVIDNHDGILLKMEGDSMLIIFRNLKKAIDCSIAMQHACAKYNLSKIATEKVLLCIGVGSGKVLRIGDTDVFGAEVNAASKLGEDKAKSNDIFVTGAVYAALNKQFSFVELEAPTGVKGAYKLNY